MANDVKRQHENGTVPFGDLIAPPTGSPVRPAVIIFLTGLLALLWRFFGNQEFYQQSLAAWHPLAEATTVNAAFYRFAMCFLLFGVIPAAVVTLGFRQSLADYGWTLGRWRRTLAWAIVSVPLMVIVAWFASDAPEYQKVYPVNRNAGEMFLAHALGYLLFYIGWESFFRGFVLFGLAKTLGPLSAIMIQATISGMLHIGDPAGEAFGGFFMGIVWGLAVFRTRSLLASFSGHATLGLALDYFLCFAK